MHGKVDALLNLSASVSLNNQPPACANMCSFYTLGREETQESFEIVSAKTTNSLRLSGLYRVVLPYIAGQESNKACDSQY